MKTLFGWSVVIGLIGAGAVVLLSQRPTQMRLDREVAELRRENRERARRQEENRRLAAALPAVAEMERLRADHAAIPRLRAEIAALQARVEGAREAGSAARFEAGSKVPAGEWRNTGTATAKATLETVLWAAAGGDVDGFARCLTLPEGPVRQQALALLERLPAGVRERYGTPERLVAFLAIKDVPLGTAQVVSWDQSQTPTPMERVRVQLSDGDEQTKDVILRFVPDGAEWKLALPAGVIPRYAALLKVPLPKPAAADAR